MVHCGGNVEEFLQQLQTAREQTASIPAIDTPESIETQAGLREDAFSGAEGDLASPPSPEMVAATIRELSLLPYDDNSRRLATKNPELILAVLEEMPIKRAARMAESFSKVLTVQLITKMDPRRASFFLEALNQDASSWGGQASSWHDILVDLDDRDSRSLVTSLTPAAAAVLLSATPAPLAAEIISATSDDAALAILGEMREAHELVRILAHLPVMYTTRVLAIDTLPVPTWSLLENLPPQIAARILQENYERGDAIKLLERMWTAKSRYILDHLDVNWFTELADRLADNRLAELLEHRSPQAREYLTNLTSISTQRGAKLLTLMDPQEADWLLDGVSDEDKTQLFRNLSVTDRVIFYVIDPVKYDYVTEALGDGPGMEWQQDDATLERYAGLLAAAEPGRVDAALRAADWEQAADLLVLMPPRAAARICSQSKDFSSVATLGYTFYRMKPTYAAKIVEKVPRSWAQECFQYLGSPHAFRIFEKLQPRIAVRILEGMEPLDAASLLKAAEPERLEEILTWIDDDFASEIRRNRQAVSEEGEDE